MRSIRLNSTEWRVDESKSLGSGGFGQVFHGIGLDGSSVAIKRLNVTAQQVAHRELQVADRLMERGLVHVLPFLDAGQDANSDEYFMVMPLAERDLQSEIDEKGSVPEIEALAARCKSFLFSSRSQAAVGRLAVGVLGRCALHGLPDAEMGRIS